MYKYRNIQEVSGFVPRKFNGETFESGMLLSRLKLRLKIVIKYFGNDWWELTEEPLWFKITSILVFLH